MRCKYALGIKIRRSAARHGGSALRTQCSEHVHGGPGIAGVVSETLRNMAKQDGTDRPTGSFGLPRLRGLSSLQGKAARGEAAVKAELQTRSADSLIVQSVHRTGSPNGRVQHVDPTAFQAQRCWRTAVVMDIARGAGASGAFESSSSHTVSNLW